MPMIRPIKDLRNTTEISNMCHDTEEPIFITKNGYGDMVVMSMEAYEKKMARIDLYNELSKAEEDIANGRIRDAEEVFSELRAKHFGK